MSATNHATIQIASGDGLDVRLFSVQERMSDLFHVDLVAVSHNLDIDFDEVIGKEATFELQTSNAAPSWAGVCSSIRQIRVDEDGLATYELVVVPRAWLMTQRRNYRIFQMMTELDIVKKVLGEWGVEIEDRTRSSYKPRKYKVQYDETDFAFVSRMLEDAGISYFFEGSGGSTVMVLDDTPTGRDATKPLLPFTDTPGATGGEFVTNVLVTQRLRPGKVTLGDLDYRRASSKQPSASASGGLEDEGRLEQFQYEPGAFLFAQGGGGGKTPTADDRGVTRTDEGIGGERTQNRLDAKRGASKRIALDSNALDLRPGVVTSVVDHPHRALAPTSTLLVIETSIDGDHDEQWRAHVALVSTDSPHRPALKTPRPKVKGLESATVVGPDGEEIHTDEYGRIRVQFHWDREGQRNEGSSCWIPSSQPWAGSGFGGVNLPRIGQEVFVAFLGGDPDRPVVLGRVFTQTQNTPYELPKYKNVTGIRSQTSPRLVMGAADGGTAGAGDTLLHGGHPMTSAQLSSLVSSDGPFKAASPNVAAHNEKASELVFDDTAGKEIAYLQAQKDFNLVVKNNWTTVVGNHEATAIGTDELLTIDHAQEITVGSDRTINVGGKEETTVEHEIIVKTSDHSAHFAKSFMRVKSETKIRLEVGKSSIEITPDRIILQSPKVDFNPESKGEDPAEVAEKAHHQQVIEKAARNAINNKMSFPSDMTHNQAVDALKRQFAIPDSVAHDIVNPRFPR